MDLSVKLPSDHRFLKAILKTWSKLHSTEPADEEEVQKQPIWNNKYILIQQRPVVWQRWENVGIHYINDLIHDTLLRFLSHLELGAKFGITIAFLELLQIRTAILCLWKRMIQNPAKTDLQTKPTITTYAGDHTSIIGTSSKKTYYTLIDHLKPPVTSQARWNEIFPVNARDTNKYWAAIYKNPYKSVRDTKFQAFAFRLIHRFIPCNRYLRNRIRTDDRCSFCMSEETIEHFLFHCPIVQTFWRQLVAWFEREADVHLDVPIKEFLFGVPSSEPQARVINFVLIFTKFFVYRQKLFHEGSLELMHYLKEFRRRLQVEKYLISIEGKRTSSEDGIESTLRLADT